MYLVVLIFIISIAILYNSFHVIDYINTKPNENISDKISGRIIISTLTSTFVVCLFLKYSLTVTFIKYFLLIIFLMIDGYIDYYTKSVYTFLSVIFLIISIIFVIVDIYNGTDFKQYIIAFSGCTIISVLFACLHFINWGDVEVFAIVSLFLGGLGGFISIVNLIMTFTIAGICSIFLVIIKKLKINSRDAFCPYIFISTILILILT